MPTTSSLSSVSASVLNWDGSSLADLLLTGSFGTVQGVANSVGLLYSGASLLAIPNPIPVTSTVASLTATVTFTADSAVFNPTEVGLPGATLLATTHNPISVVAGDVNGDGFSDLVFADPGSATIQVSPGVTAPVGRVYLVRGRASSPSVFSLSYADTIGQGLHLGGGLTALGDVNGDGLADFAVSQDASASPGALYVIDGSTSPTLAPSPTFSRAAGSNPGLLTATAGDFNGDGKVDFAVGDPANNRVYLYWAAASFSTTLTPSNADLTLTGETTTGQFGTLASTPGLDVNGDRVSDLVIGDPLASGGSGKIYLITGLRARDPAFFAGPPVVTPITNRNIPGLGDILDAASSNQGTIAPGQSTYYQFRTIGDGSAGKTVGVSTNGGGASTIYEPGSTTFLPSTGGTLSANSSGAYVPGLSYSTNDLGTLGGNNNQVTGISPNGLIVGYSDVPADSKGVIRQHAYLWNNGTLTDLNASLPGALSSYAQAVNSSGQVVGYYIDGSNFTHAFLWSNGTGTDLNPQLAGLIGTGGTGARASAINAHGQVAGTVFLAGGIAHGFFWNGIDAYAITTPAILGFGGSSTANGLNDSGQVVGQIDLTPRSSGRGYTYHGYLWQAGVLADLAPVVGGQESVANAINNSGQVVGWSLLGFVGSNNLITHAALWQNGLAALDLDVATSSYSVANAINDAGQVVGGGQRAFLWQSGVITDLNTLVPAGSSPSLTGATGIGADESEIVGTDVNTVGASLYTRSLVARQSIAIGGLSTSKGILEFDLSGYARDVVTASQITAATLSLDYYNATQATGQSLKVSVLRDEGDGRVSPTDASSAVAWSMTIALDGSKSSGVLKIDLAAAIRAALAAGETRITIRIEANGSASLAIHPIQVNGSHQTSLSITESPRPGVLIDVFDANGRILASKRSIADMRTFAAGIYYVRVSNPSTTSVAYTLTINPPMAGQTFAGSGTSGDRDEIHGGGDKDILIGGTGLDRISGEGDIDTYYAEDAQVRDFDIDYKPGTNGSTQDAIPISPSMSLSASLAQPASLDPIVSFADANLRAAIASALGIPLLTSAQGVPTPARSIFASDLTNLTNLDASNRGIADLSGLELATNLRVLNLANNHLSSLLVGGSTTLSAPRPLYAAIPGLVSIDLDNNAIVDLSPLVGLTGLRALSVDNNPLASLAPLSNLGQLRFLSADGLPNGLATIPGSSPYLPYSLLKSIGGAVGFGTSMATSTSLIASGNPVGNTTLVFDPTTGQTIQTISGTTGTQFGASVALWGNELIVGAPGATTSAGAQAGLVYFYDATTGQLLRTISEASLKLDGHGFGQSLAIFGNDLIVGTPGSSASVGFDGEVYLFDILTGNLLRKIDNPGSPGSSLFGWSVAAVGNSIAIGAPNALVNGVAGAGAVYVFSGTTGGQTYQEPTPTTGDQFGWSVAGVAGNLLVGSPSTSSFGVYHSGAAYLFTSKGDGTFAAIPKTIANPTPNPGDSFGYAVGSSNGNLLIGDPGARAAAQGVVSQFHADGGTTDGVGNNNGTWVGTPTYGPGVLSASSQAFQLNGTNAVNVGNPTNLQVSSGTFSVDAYVKFNPATAGGSTVANTDMVVVDKMNESGTTPNSDGWLLEKAANGHFSFVLGGGGPGTVNIPFLGYGSYAETSVLQPDGKILIAGYAYDSQSRQESAIVRLNPDGSLDTSFNGSGLVLINVTGNITDYVRAMALQSDGKIVVLATGGFGGGSMLARFLPNGTLDTSFKGSGIISSTIFGGTSDLVNALVIQPDGKIVVGGDQVIVTPPPPGGIFGSSTGLLAAARFNADGSRDISFNGTGWSTIPSYFGYQDYVYTMILQQDGKILLGGTSTSSPGNGGPMIVARLNTNGSIDTSFYGSGRVVLSNYGRVETLLVQPNGKILVGGDINNYTTLAIYRLNGDGSADNSFGTFGVVTSSPGAGTLSTVDFTGLALQSDGKIVAVGSTYIYQQSTNYIVDRFNPNGSPDLGFNGSGTIKVSTSERDNAQVFVLGDGRIVFVSTNDVTSGNSSYSTMNVESFTSAGAPDPTFGLATINGATSGSATAIVGMTSVVANQWYHVQVVKNSTGVFLYVNGALDGLISVPNFRDTNSGNLTIGGRVIAGSTPTIANGFNGLIDEVRIGTVAPTFNIGTADLYGFDGSNVSLIKTYANPNPSTALGFGSGVGSLGGEVLVSIGSRGAYLIGAPSPSAIDVFEGQALGDSALATASTLSSLQVLSLSHQQVTNLGPLAAMTSLQGLDVHGNLVADLSSLAGLTALQSLNVGGNPLNNDAQVNRIPALLTRTLANGGSVGYDPDTPPVIANIPPQAIAPVVGTTTFFDDTFDNADWTHLVFAGSGTTSSYQATSTAFGISGAFQEGVESPTPGINVGHLFEKLGTYNPITQGAISSVNFEIDLKVFSGPGLGLGFLIRQGGNNYIAAYDSTLNTSTPWADKLATGLKATDFTLWSGLVGASPTPDFSASGGPIEFGYVTANSGGPYTAAWGVDNFRAVVNPSSSPSGPTPFGFAPPAIDPEGDPIFYTATSDTPGVTVTTGNLSNSDQDFSDRDWSHLVIVATGSGINVVTATQSSVNGLSGTYQAGTLTWASGTITSANIDLAAGTYNPSQLGSITSFDDSFDFRTSGTTSAAVLIKQGSAYYEPGNGLFGNTPYWTHHADQGLQATDFVLVAGTGPTHPDFSAAGLPMQFGYFTSVTGMATTNSVTWGLDNFAITLHGTRVILTPSAGFQGIAHITVTASDGPSGSGDLRGRSSSKTFDLNVGTVGVVTGNIWQDQNQDLSRDNGELGASGFTVTLHPNSGGADQSTVSDTNGNYAFDGIAPGTYTVSVASLASSIPVYLGQPTVGLAADLIPGSAGSSPNYLASYNGSIYFEASTASSGQQLWKFDGTSASQLTNFNPMGGGFLPSDLTVYSGSLYFNAYSTTSGFELWKYDGSTVSLVADIAPGAAGSSPANLTVANGLLYFTAFTSSTGTELYKFDGTSVSLAADVFAGTSSSTPSDLTAFGSFLYFAATLPTGRGLFRFDGANLSQVAGTLGLSPTNLVAFNGSLYFNGNAAATGSELYRYDGTSVTLAADILPGASSSSPQDLVVYNGAIYFDANGPTTGQELYKFDGTTASLVADINPGTASSLPYYLTVYNGVLYFRATGPTGSNLYSYDGHAVSLIPGIAPAGGASSASVFSVSGGRLYFNANDGQHGSELWSLVTPSPLMASYQVVVPGGAVSSGLNFAEFRAILAGSNQTILEGGTASFAGSVNDPNLLDGISFSGFSWNFGDNSTAGSGLTTSHTYASAGVYTARLTATYGTSTYSDTITVTVVNVPPQNVSISGPVGGVEGTSINLTSSFSSPGTAGSLAYDWNVVDDNGQSIVDGTSSTFAFTPFDNGKYVITLTIRDKDGGIGSATQTIVVANAVPIPTIQGIPANPGEGVPINLTTLVADPGSADVARGFLENWTVTKNGVAFASGSTASIRFNPDDNGVYLVTLTVQDKDGGVGSTAATINVVNTPPTVVFVNPPSSSPEGTPIQLTAQINDPSPIDGTIGFTYAWSVTKNGLAFASGTTATPGFTPDDNGSYLVTLTAKDKDGGVGSGNWTVAVTNVAPGALTIGGPSTVDESSTVVFSGTFLDPGTADIATAVQTWHVVSTNGQVIADGTGPSFAITPNHAGTYTLTYTVRDKDGGSGSTQATLVVGHVAPTLTLSGSSTSNEGSTYTLGLGAIEVGTESISGWLVNWGDNSTSMVSGNPPTVTHVYLDGPNGYTITATATDEIGTYSTVNSLAVFVANVAPSGLSVVPSSLTVNQGDLFTETESFGDPGADTWTSVANYGDGSGPAPLLGSAKSFAGSHIFTGFGYYAASFLVTDKDGGQGTASVNVNVLNVAPTVDLGLATGATSASIAAGGTFATHGSFADPGRDVWTATVDYGDGSGIQPLAIDPVSQGFTLAHSYLAAGNFNLKVSVSDNHGGTGIALASVEVAGISVTPTSGLSTTAYGGTAAFSVVLLAAPLAVVTIPLSSSNPGAGTISISSLTFTPSNWNHPQIVTVVGSSTPGGGSNTSYLIVTGPALSTDPGDNGLDPPDVSVTNYVNVAPGAPVLLKASDSGRSPTDGITNITAPTFSVATTAPASTTVELLRGTSPAGPFVVVATALAGSNSVQLTDFSLYTASLRGNVDGTYYYESAQFDQSGNLSDAAGPITVVLLTTPPPVPVAPKLDPASISGPNKSLPITNNRFPLFDLTGVQPNDQFLLYRSIGGSTPILVGTGMVNANQVMDQVGTPIDGTYLYQAEQIDAAGNVSKLGVGVAVTIITQAPPAPTLTLLTADDSGLPSHPNVTNVRSPRFSGTGTAGLTVAILAVQGTNYAAGSVQASTVVAANGTYLVQVVGPLADGNYSLVARLTDTAGNLSYSAPLGLTIKAIPPQIVPTLTINSLDDTGIKGDGVTTSRQPRLIGKTDPGDIVTLYLLVNNQLSAPQLYTTASSTDGSFSFQYPGNLPNGNYQFVARSSDAAGNLGTLSPAFTARIVTIAGDYYDLGYAQFTVFRPTTETEIVRGAGFLQVDTTPGRDVPLQYDFNGDGKTDLAAYRYDAAQYYGVLSNNAIETQQFGQGNLSLPVSGTYDSSGNFDFALFNPNTATWAVNVPRPGGVVLNFGVVGTDIPVPSAYNGGGITEIATFRGKSVFGGDADSFNVVAADFVNNYQVSFTDPSVIAKGFIYKAGDIPAPADYDGIGRDEFAIYRPTTGQFFILNTPNLFDKTTWTLRTVTVTLPGGPKLGDQPASEDYEGTGKASPTVFRPSNSTFYEIQTTTGLEQTIQFGQPGVDVAAAGPLQYRLSALFGVLPPPGGGTTSAVVLPTPPGGRIHAASFSPPTTTTNPAPLTTIPMATPPSFPTPSPSASIPVAESPKILPHALSVEATRPIPSRAVGFPNPRFNVVTPVGPKPPRFSTPANKADTKAKSTHHAFVQPKHLTVETSVGRPKTHHTADQHHRAIETALNHLVSIKKGHDSD